MCPGFYNGHTQPFFRHDSIRDIESAYLAHKTAKQTGIFQSCPILTDVTKCPDPCYSEYSGANVLILFNL